MKIKKEEKKKMIIKKSIFYAMIAVVVIALFGMVAAFNSGPASAEPNTNSLTGDVAVASSPSEDYQNVKLTFENYEYRLSPSTLKKDIPVRMEVDLSTVSGCIQDIRIPSFGVSKYVSQGDNIIEFTPDKSGTFNIACSMNMGRGTFTVAQSNGQVAEYKEATIDAGGDSDSCGLGNAGGCGCGA